MSLLFYKTIQFSNNNMQLILYKNPIVAKSFLTDRSDFYRSF